MVRVLATGDHHFHEHTRFSECVAVHEWMIDVARSEGVDLCLSGGDVYESASTPREREAVAEWLTRMAEVCPVVIARGNHDRKLDVELMRRLRTKHPVIVEDRAAVHNVAGASVGVVAWPNVSSLAAMLGRPLPATAVDDAARAALRSVLLGLSQQWGDGPRILLGHFMVDGSMVSTGQPLLGMPLNVGLYDLSSAGAQIGFMSHIHMAQDFWSQDETLFRYTGSPFRTDFGQLEGKSVTVATLENGLFDYEAIPTPCAPMIHLDAVWEGPDRAFCRDLPTGIGSGLERGAEIRFRYSVEADQRDAAKAAAAKVTEKLKADGAVAVKVEECVRPTTRARAPEIVTATSLVAKLAALRASRGQELTEARVAALNAKTLQVEEEIRNAS